MPSSVEMMKQLFKHRSSICIVDADVAGTCDKLNIRNYNSQHDLLYSLIYHSAAGSLICHFVTNTISHRCSRFVSYRATVSSVKTGYGSTSGTECVIMITLKSEQRKSCSNHNSNPPSNDKPLLGFNKYLLTSLDLHIVM